MAARKSRPAQDHTGETLYGSPNAHPAIAPDGEPARVYSNQGSGLTEVSGQNYNEAHGRVASAPTVGGDSHANRSPKGMPPGAPSSKRVEPID